LTKSPQKRWGATWGQDIWLIASQEGLPKVGSVRRNNVNARLVLFEGEVDLPEEKKHARVRGAGEKYLTSR